MSHFIRLNTPFALVALLCMVPISTAFAGPVIRGGETVTVGADQILEGDFYGFGNSVTLSSKADHDVYVAGGTVTINGDVAGDLTVLGGVVQIHGSVGDDVRVVGGEVTIAQPVGGDVVIVSGSLTLLSTASVGGDVLFVGSNTSLEGDIHGSIVGQGENIRINAPVGGKVSVNVANSLALGDRAAVKGDVCYTSSADIARSQNAVVEGTIVKNAAPSAPKDEMNGRALAIEFLMLLFGAITLFLIARKRLGAFAAHTFVEYGKQGLVGLGLVIVVPVVSILLITSILGMFVGFILLFLYGALLVLSWVTVSIMLGLFIMRALKKSEALTLVPVLLGACASVLVSLIPVIGPLFLAVLFLVVFGGYGLMLYRSID